MSAHLKDRVEKIEEAMAKLREEASEGKPIIVEGKKDAEALVGLGIEGRILTLKTGGKSFLDMTRQIEALKAGEIILLLDYDRRGREATKRLQQELERVKIRANVRCWRELHGLTGREVQCLEGFPRYLETLKNKASLT